MLPPGFVALCVLSPTSTTAGAEEGAVTQSSLLLAVLLRSGVLSLILGDERDLTAPVLSLKLGDMRASLRFGEVGEMRVAPTFGDPRLESERNILPESLRDSRSVACERLPRLVRLWSRKY
jgi:hypothetical protein